MTHRVEISRGIEDLLQSQRSITRVDAQSKFGQTMISAIIRQIAAGGVSLRKIADELNTRGIKTARGGLWYAATVRNVLARDNEIEDKAA